MVCRKRENINSTFVFAIAKDCKKWQKIILKYHKYLGEFFQKKYVCTRTRTHIVLIALKFA